MTTIDIQISGPAMAVIPRLADRAGLLGALARTMDLQNQFTVGHIQSARLSGPTSDGSLSVRTNRLRSSIRSSAAAITTGGVESTIGTNVVYAGVHEFGGTFTVNRKPGVVRLRTDRGGNLLRQGANGKLAVFAKKTHKRAREVAFEGSTYTVTYPERAPITKGIQDRAGEYGEAMSDAILDFWNGGKT